MLTRHEANAIYDAGRETVVHVLLEMSQKIDQFAAELTKLKAGVSGQAPRNRLRKIP